MTIESEHHEQFKNLVNRNRRTIKLLMLLLGLALIDGFNRYYQASSYYQQLPIAIYDFTVKYQQPLTLTLASNFFMDAYNQDERDKF